MARLIHIPSVSWNCRIGKRAAARNAIGNVLRAAKNGKCDRAKKIMRDRDFLRATECVPHKTMLRVYRRVDECV